MITGAARWWVGSLVLLAFGGATLEARAETPQRQYVADYRANTRSSDNVAKEWYGAPILISDMAAVVTFAIGVASEGGNSELSSAMMLTGVAAYALGGPIVHFSEEQVGRGFASLGLRVGGPIVLATTGALLGSAGNSSNCGGEYCDLEGPIIGAAIGFVAGIIAAPIIDNAVLAYKPVARSATALSVTPLYHPTTNQVGLTLRGNW